MSDDGDEENYPGASAPAHETMRCLGNFVPTIHAQDRQVKGYAPWGNEFAGKVYLTSTDLREVAQHLQEIADWLDVRAAAPPSGEASRQGDGA